MNSGSPSRVVGGFEVLEIPDGPYHGRYKKSCASQNCYAPSQALPGYFEYYESPKSSEKRSDDLVLVLIFAVAIVLFCIISSSK